MEAHKICFKSSLQPSNRLDFSFQNVYNKGTKFSVVLAISPLVVRRTFYLIFKDRNAKSWHYYFQNGYNYQLYLHYITKGYIRQEFFEEILRIFRGLKMEFSERLKESRKQARLTQVEIAEKLGISQPAYASWERGTKKPTQENLVKIAQILNVTIDYLVGNFSEEITNNKLEDIEILFRKNSEGLTDEEKSLFIQELIAFMEERKKLFEKDN